MRALEVLCINIGRIRNFPETITQKLAFSVQKELFTKVLIIELPSPTQGTLSPHMHLYIYVNASQERIPS